MPTSSVQRWFFTPSPWSFLVVSRPGLGIASVGRFVGFRGFPDCLRNRPTLCVCLLLHSLDSRPNQPAAFSGMTCGLFVKPVRGSHRLRLQKGEGDNQVWWDGGDALAYQGGQVDAIVSTKAIIHHRKLLHFAELLSFSPMTSWSNCPTSLALEMKTSRTHHCSPSTRSPNFGTKMRAGVNKKGTVTVGTWLYVCLQGSHM